MHSIDACGLLLQWSGVVCVSVLETPVSPIRTAAEQIEMSFGRSACGGDAVLCGLQEYLVTSILGDLH